MAAEQSKDASWNHVPRLINARPCTQTVAVVYGLRSRHRGEWSYGQNTPGCQLHFRAVLLKANNVTIQYSNTKLCCCLINGPTRAIMR